MLDLKSWMECSGSGLYFLGFGDAESGIEFLFLFFAGCLSLKFFSMEVVFDNIQEVFSI